MNRPSNTSNSDSKNKKSKSTLGYSSRECIPDNTITSQPLSIGEKKQQEKRYTAPPNSPSPFHDVDELNLNTSTTIRHQFERQLDEYGHPFRDRNSKGKKIFRVTSSEGNEENPVAEPPVVVDNLPVMEFTYQNPDISDSLQEPPIHPDVKPDDTFQDANILSHMNVDHLHSLLFNNNLTTPSVKNISEERPSCPVGECSSSSSQSMCEPVCKCVKCECPRCCGDCTCPPECVCNQRDTDFTLSERSTDPLEDTKEYHKNSDCKIYSDPDTSECSLDSSGHIQPDGKSEPEGQPQDNSEKEKENKIDDHVESAVPVQENKQDELKEKCKRSCIIM